MTTIVLRNVKGSVLTNAEVDANFNNLNLDKVEKTSPEFAGQSKFPAGTTSVPSISPIGDTNTGISFPSADTIAVSSGGVESLRVDNSAIYVGGSPNAEAVRVLRVPSSVNRIQAAGAIANNTPSIGTQGSDTNISLDITTKGAGDFNFKSTNGTKFIIKGDLTTVNYIEARAGVSNHQEGVSLKAAGVDGNIPMSFFSKGISPIGFYVGDTLQFSVPYVESSVNYAQMLGGSIGNGVTLKSAGSDTSVDLNLESKGAGGRVKLVAGGNVGCAVYSVSSSVNWLTLKGSTSLNPVLISAEGQDNDIGVNITPKGNATVNISSAGSVGLSLSQGGSLGANMQFVGNGVSNPTKYIRVKDGNFEIIDHGYYSPIFTLTNAGNCSITGSISTGATPSSLGTNSTVGGLEIGWKIVPQSPRNYNYTITTADSGCHIYSDNGNTYTYTIPSNASLSLPIGTAITFIARNGNQIITTSDLLIWAGTGVVGARTLTTFGIATAIKIAPTEWIVSGTGLV